MIRETINDKEIHIVTGGDAAFVPGISVTTASALENLSKNRVAHIHILDGGISIKDRHQIKKVCGRIQPKCTVEFYQLKDYDFSNFAPGPNGSRMFYARLAMAEILSSLKKAIYIDSDTVILGRIEELWDLDIGNRLALVCKDRKVARLSDDCPWLLEEKDTQKNYFNSGVMLVNLFAWREEEIFEKSLEFSSKSNSGLKWWDQTLLNFLLKDGVEFISEKWNWQREEKFGNPETVGVIHFTSPKKPWLYWGKDWRFDAWRKCYGNYYGTPLRLFCKPKSFRGLINGWWDNLVLTNRLAWKLKVVLLKYFLLITYNKNKRCDIMKSLEFYTKINLRSRLSKESAHGLGEPRA